MQDIYIARQPIFDRALSVYGYELLCRPAGRAPAASHNGDAATSEVILNTFTVFGLDELVGGRLAFINLTRAFLVDRHPVPFPPERVVLEVLEDTEPDAELLDALDRLRRAGYRIALDDFVYQPRLEPLVRAAHLVKVEVPRIPPAELAAQARLLRRLGVDLLAEKVETQGVFEQCRDAGFQYFQGFFFERPSLVRGSTLATPRLQALNVLARLQAPEQDTDALVELISNDLGLSYKLLRYLNSPLFRAPRPVDSIRRAVVYLGERELRTWASLMALASVPGKPQELATSFMVRARLCQSLGREAGLTDPDRCFTAGLFSGLDALLDAPMDELLAKLPLAEGVREALLHRQGEVGRLLEAVIELQRGEPAGLARLGFPAEQVNALHADAIRWAEAVTRLGNGPGADH